MMASYSIYEQGGENTRHAGRIDLCKVEAETAAIALYKYGGEATGEVVQNPDDDSAFRAFADHIDKHGLEHLLCADGPCSE